METYTTQFPNNNFVFNPSFVWSFRIREVVEIVRVEEKTREDSLSMEVSLGKSFSI